MKQTLQYLLILVLVTSSSVIAITPPSADWWGNVFITRIVTGSVDEQDNSTLDGTLYYDSTNMRLRFDGEHTDFRSEPVIITDGVGKKFNHSKA